MERPQRQPVPRVLIPANVATAADAHSRACDAYDDAYRTRNAARVALKAADARDLVADAEQLVAGKDPLPEAKREEPAAAKALAEAERSREVAAKAGALARVAVHDEILKRLDEWLPAVDEEEEAAVAEALESLAKFRRSAARVEAARGARLWLAEVTTEYMPTRAPVAGLEVANALAKLEAAVAPPPAPPPYRALSERERSFEPVLQPVGGSAASFA